MAIPPAVEAEFGQRVTGWAETSPPWMTRPEMDAVDTDYQTWCEAGLLEFGEAQALALAEELDADWFLTDDDAARLFAQLLGFEVHGSLGVVLWAAATKRLEPDAARSTLEALFHSSLWLSSRVRTEALDALETLFRP